MRHLAYFSLPLLFSAVGCTTLQWDRYHQYVRVESVKPGAEIRSEGKLLGHTPALVNLRREHQPALDLRYPGQPERKIHVPTRYRWGASFGSDLIFGILAPVAWGIDYWSGTAWELKEPEIADLPGRAAKAPPEVRIIAIAPPEASTEFRSNAIASLLQEHLGKESSKESWRILDYSKTFSTFEDSNISYQNPISGSDPVDLFGELKATHVVTSLARIEGENLRVIYQLLDVRRATLGPIQQFTAPAQVLTPEDESWRRRATHWFADMLPNTFSIDAASDRTEVTLRERDAIVGKSQRVGDLFGEASQFLGNISIASLLPPRGQTTFAAHFRFTPLLTFAYHNLSFDDKAAYFEQTDFRVFRTSLGFGPELDLTTAIGVFYVGLLPGAAYSWMNWSSPESGGSATSTNLNVAITAGFYRYFSNRWALRLFYRQIEEDSSLWNRVLDQSQGVDIPVEEVREYITGVSVCFYFPDLRRRFRRP